MSSPSRPARAGYSRGGREREHRLGGADGVVEILARLTLETALAKQRPVHEAERVPKPQVDAIGLHVAVECLPVMY